ncbi:MAG: PP2C family protein-serine/threonine phosphatase [Candidatus Poribacteria bacterium]
MFRQLKRGIVRAHKTLLLLADEAESLIAVGENDPGLLGRLRSVLQDATFVRTVLCGSRRLSEVSQIELVGSAFLDGFEPILFMSSLTEADANALIAQSHTGGGVQVSDEMATEIKEKTNRHPYLIQSICLYLYDHEMSLEKAYDFVMQQGMAERAFADDYRYLAPIEKDILMQIYQTSPPAPLHKFVERGASGATLPQIQQQVLLDADIIRGFLFTLEASGYIKREGNSFRLANYFFTRWLRSNEARLSEITSVVSDAAMKAIKEQQSSLQEAERERVHQELARAREIQLSLLPEAPPAISGFDIAGTSYPAKEVSGDFFDYLPLPDGRLGIATADVTGKGLPAAMIASMAHGMLDIESQSGGSAKNILTRLNQRLCARLQQGLFVAVALAILDPTTKELSYSAAAQPYLLLLRNAQVKELGEGGFPLGISAKTEYPLLSCQLEAGDVLLLVSDGVVEAANSADEMYGFPRLNDAFCSVDPSLNAEELLEYLLEDVNAFTQVSEQSDDMTLVVVKVAE